MSEATRIPLFPLNTVLLPGSLLPLRIFEPRYVSMVSQCLKTDSGFGVALIREGSEVGEAAASYAIGTLAMIRDFDNLPDGLLGITVEGTRRFRSLSVDVQPDMLNVAEVLLLDDAEVSVPPEYSYLKEYLFELLMEHGVDINEELVAMTDNAGWLGYRLMDLLPLSILDKQCMLEQDDPLQRFKMLKQHLS